MGLAKRICIICTFFTINIVSAQNLDFFHKRFDFIRENGRVVEVVDKSIKKKINLSKYLQFLQANLKQEQNLLASKNDYDFNIEELLTDGRPEKAMGEEKNNVDITVRSLRALQNVNFDKIFSNKKFKYLINLYQGKLNTALKGYNPNVLARTDNATYFYKKNRSYAIINWALNLAKKKLTHIPILNTASYIIVRSEKLFSERRFFHQNILIHYLERFSPEALGLTQMDVNHIYSSIYESRIAWFAFWESNAAVANWDDFGNDRFFASFRAGSSKLRKFKTIYDDVGERSNYAFQEVNYNGDSVIINLFDKESLFQSKPSIAFYNNSPNKIKRLRTVLELGQLGVNFLPLPAFVKSLAEKYMKSFYVKQKLNEGALLGYFEMNSDFKSMEILRRQYLNPFDFLY